MGFKIQLLPTAKRDLLCIAEYLMQFYENTYPKFISMLDRNMASIEIMPYLGMVYEDFRRLVMDDYLVFYQVDEDKNIIFVARILHGSQDIQNRLSE